MILTEEIFSLSLCLGCFLLIYLARLSFFNIDSLSIGKISSDSVPSAHLVSHSALTSSQLTNRSRQGELILLSGASLRLPGEENGKLDRSC